MVRKTRWNLQLAVGRAAGGQVDRQLDVEGAVGRVGDGGRLGGLGVLAGHLFREEIGDLPRRYLIRRRSCSRN